MTSAQQSNLNAQKQAYLADIRSLEQAMVSLATQEYVSVTLSTSGGTKSFSRQTGANIPGIIEYMTSKIAAINRALRNDVTGGIRTIQIVRCCP